MEFNYWKDYFIVNRGHFRQIDLDREDDTLTPEEWLLVGASIRHFQRGEQSEGRNLYGFAEKQGDQDYLQCISLFIQEEQRHAMVLAAYMRKHRVPLLRKHWVDGVFRKLRRISGLGNSIRVLLVAEIVAKVYYQALFNATSSGLLKEICTQILKDEDGHIHFQCDGLKRFQRPAHLPAKLFYSWTQLLLITGTLPVVWMYHRKVFRKGGYSFRRFATQALSVYFEAVDYIRREDKAALRFQ